ncbi:MAG: hypothetical protein ACP5G1_03580 [Nanopusillaceae archaeon]
MEMEINAYDTETYNAKVFLLADAKGHFIFDFDLNTYDMLNFLYKTSEKINFFYNIAFDFGAILKPYLSLNDYSEFLKSKLIKFDKYKIRYINNKAFSLRYRNDTRYFFDIANFYTQGTTYLPLNYVSKTFLNEYKDPVDRERLATDKNYILDNKQMVINYCVRDAYLTLKLADLYVSSVQDTFKIMPAKFYSKASISKEYLKVYHENLLKLNKALRHNKLYNRYLKYIKNAYRGGIFNVNILGKVDNVIDIDINSAYPSFIAKIPRLDKFELRHIDTFDKSAFTGAYHVYVKYNHFLPYRNKNIIIYPISQEFLETYLSHEEVKFMLENFPNSIKVVDGIALYLPSENLEFSDIYDIYEKRKQLKKSKDSQDKIKQWNLKIVMNAIYGVMAQQKPHLTQFTNLLLASYITASTRVKIYNEIMKIGWNNVIHVATDGILMKNVREYPENETLGEFSLSGKFDYEITYMNGLYLLANKDKLILKNRGFKNISINDLVNATGHTLTIKQTKFFKVLESLRQHDPQKINVKADVDKVLELYSNLEKNEIDTDKLTFEYLNFNHVYVNPIIVSEPETFL